MHITPNFTYAELTSSQTAVRNGWDNTPNDSEMQNLKRLADFLEQVKELLGGKVIIVTSAFRSKKVNDAIGSNDRSQHRIGCAADIKVPGMTPDEVVAAITQSQIGYDQVIREFDSWTHVSIPNDESTAPRKQALIIDRKGVREFA